MIYVYIVVRGSIKGYYQVYKYDINKVIASGPVAPVLAGSFFSYDGFRIRSKYSNRAVSANRTVKTTLSIAMVQLAIGFSCQYYTFQVELLLYSISEG